MKTCFKCLRALPLEDFYPHPQMGDGHLNKCKDCARKDAEARRQLKSSDPAWLEREAERQRAKGRRVNNRDRVIATARRAVRARGRDRSFHWHHWSYLPEHRLDVIRLLPGEHRLVHHHMKLDREALQYRRNDSGELMTTRAAHEEFIGTLLQAHIAA